MDFEAFLQTVEENKWELYGIEIFRHGKVIRKYGKNPSRRYPIYSATKAVTSTAAGIASKEGVFCVDDSLLCYLGDEVPEVISRHQLENLEKLSIKRLLTMSVEGFPFRPQGEDWLAFSLQCPLENTENRSFSYSNIPAYLVGVALEKAVGGHLMHYLQPRLWEPLGIKDPVYKDCPSGHFYGASGMELTVNELGRIGQLYLQGGQYGGRQILDPSWVREATAVQQMNREGGYGYFIWKYGDGFRISGKWGQRCYVFPDRGLMITYLSNMAQGAEELARAMERYLL